MQKTENGATAPRPRERAAERREQRRYQILRGVHERTGADCETPVSGLAVGEELGLTREQTFRSVQYLAHRGYLNYVGAGPRVCITPKGIEYLEREAGRRRSMRAP